MAATIKATTNNWRSLLVATALVMAGASALAQEGTSGIRMVESAPAPVSPWGVSFYSLATAPMNQVGDNASIFAYNYLALNYKFTKTQRVSVRPVFQYTSSGQNNFGAQVKSDTVLGDAHIVYADYEIATLGPANVSTSFKFYLPTSQSSQDKGMLLKFRPETFISMSVNRYDSITYAMKPDFYVQSRASNFDDRGREFMTNVFVLEHYVEYGLSFNRTFTLKPSVGFIDTWQNPTQNPKVPPTHYTDAKLALGLDISAMKGLNFTVSAENRFRVTDRPTVGGQRDEVAVMRPEENSLLLITNASL
jgi:hypothetical protein